MSSSSRVILDQTQASDAKNAITVLKLNYREAVQHFAARKPDRLKQTEEDFTHEMGFDNFYSLFGRDVPRTPFMGSVSEAASYYSEWLLPIISSCYSQGDLFGGSFAGNLVGALSSNKRDHFNGVDAKPEKAGKKAFSFAFFNDLGEKCGFTIEYSNNDPSAWVISIASNMDNPLLEERSVTLIYSPFFQEKSDVAFKSKMTQTTDPDELKKILAEAVYSEKANDIIKSIFTPEFQVDITKVVSTEIKKEGPLTLEKLNKDKELTKSLQINSNLSTVKKIISEKKFQNYNSELFDIYVNLLPKEDELKVKQETVAGQLTLQFRESLSKLHYALIRDDPASDPSLNEQFKMIEFYFERIQRSKLIVKHLETAKKNPFPKEHSAHLIYSHLYRTANDVFSRLLMDPETKPSEFNAVQRLLARGKLVLKNPIKHIRQFEQEVMAIINNDRIDDSFKEALLKITQSSQVFNEWKKENLSQHHETTSIKLSGRTLSFKPDEAKIKLLEQEINSPPVPSSPLYRARLQYVHELKESLHKINDTKKTIKTLQSTIASLKQDLKNSNISKKDLSAKSKELNNANFQLTRSIATMDTCYKTMQDCQDKLVQSREIMDQVSALKASPPAKSMLSSQYKLLYEEVEKETIRLMEDRYALPEDYTLLSKTLKDANAVMKNPSNYHALASDARKMNQRINTRKLGGAILMLIGSAIVAAGVLGAVYSFGISVPLGVKIGGAIFSVGLAYYLGKGSVELIKNADDRATRTEVVKTASTLAKAAQSYTPSQVNLDEKSINLDEMRHKPSRK